MERELKKIMRDVTSENPETRFYALDRLYQLKVQENDVEIPVLISLIETAAKPFAEPVDAWDHPSYYLVDFVSGYVVEDLTDAFMHHYYGLSDAAKRVALNFLCSFDDDKYLLFLEDVYKQVLALEGELLIPQNLYERPRWVRQLFEKFYADLKKEMYHPIFFSFLYYCLRNDLLHRFKSSEVVPLIHREYEQNKEAYLSYDKDYTLKFAYRSWKDTYFELRDKLVVNLALIGYYYGEEDEQLLREAMAFKDPTLRMKATVIALDKNISVSADLLNECATHVETSVSFFYELEHLKKEHLFPIRENRQHYFAKSYLFDALMEDENYERFPHTFDIQTKFDHENYYNQPVRTYVLSFVDEDEVPYVGYAGSFSLEENDDSPDIWSHTYSTYEPLADRTLDEHIAFYHSHHKKERDESREEVFYETTLRYPAWYSILAFLTAGQWVRILTKDYVSVGMILVTTVLSLWVVYLVAKRAREKKTKQVRMRMLRLEYQDGETTTEIQLHHIKKVLVEKSKGKFVELYGENNELLLAIPSRYVAYPAFAQTLRDLTDHLKEPPYIEYL